MVHAEALRPDGGGDHGHAVGERLQDLQARAAPEPDRDHDHVGAGQLGRHVRHPAGHRDVGGTVEGLDPRRGVPDEPDAGPGHLPADQRGDVRGQPRRPVHVRFVVEGRREQDHRRAPLVLPAHRREGLWVGVDHHGGVGHADPFHVLIGTQQHPIHRSGDRTLDTGPVLGVDVRLLGLEGPVVALAHAFGRPSGDHGGALALLHVLEVDEVHHRGTETGPTEPFVGPGRAEPDQVVGLVDPTWRSRCGARDRPCGWRSGWGHLAGASTGPATGASRPPGSPWSAGWRPVPSRARRVPACACRGRRTGPVRPARRGPRPRLRRAMSPPLVAGHGKNSATTSVLIGRSPACDVTTPLQTPRPRPRHCAQNVASVPDRPARDANPDRRWVGAVRCARSFGPAPSR